MPSIFATADPVNGRVLLDINFSDVSTAAYVRVLRVLDNGATTPVRVNTIANSTGDYIRLSGGKALIYDTEAPLDVPLVYTADALTLTGAVASPVSGVLLAGVSGTYVSTPDNAALDITGDIDIRADMTMLDWTPFTNASVVTKWGAAGTRAYLIQIAPDGKLSIIWSNDGTAVNTLTSTVSIPGIDGQRLAIRATLDVDNGAGGKTANFYSAPSINGLWTQIGSSVVSGGTTSIFSGTAVVEIGGHTSGTLDLFPATIHSVEIRNGIEGTMVANPNFAAQNVGTTSFTDQAGRVWTLNGTAAIVGGPPAVSAPAPGSVLASGGNLWLKAPLRPWADQRIVLNVPQEPDCVPESALFFQAMDTEARDSRTQVQVVNNRKNPISMARLRAGISSILSIISRRFVDRDNVIALNADGDPLFFEGPADYGIPDQYMSVANYTVGRLSTDHRRQWRAHAMTYVEVDRPAGLAAGVLGARWDDMCQRYATFGAATAAGVTWTEAMLGLASNVPSPQGNWFYSTIPVQYATYTALNAAFTSYTALWKGPF